MSTGLPRDISEIRAGLKQIISEVIGADLDDIDEEASLLEYVTSSLDLLAGIRMVYDKYGVLIPLRPLLEGSGSLKALAAFVEQALQMHEKNLQASVMRDIEAKNDWPRVALLPSQAHIGFLARYSSGASAAYNEPVAVRLHGPLHGPALQTAFEAAVQRHEATRAALDTNEDSIFFGPGSALSVSHDTEANLDHRLAELASKPFDAGDPLFRAELLRLAEAEHVLVLVGHALVTDREALLGILGDIAQFYGVFAQGEGASIASSRSAPAGSRPSGATAAEQPAAEEYWKNAFASGLPVLHLPTDRQRPAIKSYAGRRLSVGIPQDIRDRLVDHPDLPLSKAVFGAITCFLHRISAQREIVVGALSDPVGSARADGTVGVSREMLPIRSVYDPARSFADHADDVAGRLAAANEHRRHSLAEIIQQLDLPRDRSRSALLSAAFRTEESGSSPVFDGLASSLVMPSVEGARYDIELRLRISESGMQLCCDYSDELFEADTISRWMAGLLELLRAGVEAAGTPCGLLPVMPPEERQTLLERWNATEKAYPQDVTTFDLIVEQVRAAGDRAALRFGDSVLTYDQLLALADRYAALLAASGVRRGARVAVLLKRSPELVGALLGIWRAGAAYVPIDPELPLERIAFILADAGVAGVITSRGLASIVAHRSGDIPLLVDDGRVYPAGSLADAPAGGPDDSAYVIYTSGSTGLPKGVEIPHRALVNFLLAIQEVTQFSSTDSVLAITTPSFDISAFEMFLPLISGGVVELAEEGLAANGLDLAGRIERCKPSFVQATPSTWKALLAAGWVGDHKLKAAAAGEAISREVAEQLLQKVGELWNFYGPTETTVYSVVGRIQSHVGEPVRIGRPLRNTQVYILDEQGAPVPIGVTGELCIAGDGLARGYVNAPELTGEKFVANPFRPGELMYRTGDHARYLANGDIVWLGRIDQQVKIHGYRVELGEIESALRTIAGIRDAVVTTWVDGSGDKQLVAHLIADAPTTNAVTGIRDRLKELLPQAVIPPFFMFADRFPVSAAGKIDRAGLPLPGLGERPQASGGLPVTSTERLLADIWAKVLGIPVTRIGRDDDFMELGGHSLLMTQLMVDVRRVFGVTFNLRDFFATTVLRKFAEFVGKQERTSEAEGMPTGSLALLRSPSHARDRMAFLKREGVLPSEIAPARGLTFQPPSGIAAILLTGASGFLGSYVLDEILKTSDAHVYCLVRSRPGTDAKSRIAAQLRNYHLWQDDPKWQFAWKQRVHVVPGDVILPRLGLADAAYATLAREVDCVIHSAAHVNFIYPYEALKATNVLGLHEIIRFAFHRRIKALHYISTAAIWPMGSELTFFESDPIDQGKLLNLGYDEAKWVGEQCLIHAMDRGLPVARYRPGEVGGDSESGRCVLNHFLFSALKGFLQFGALPPIDTYIDVAPVDYVAKAIVHMALHKNPLGRAFHLTNPRSGHMNEAMRYLRNFGYQFDELPFDELRRRLIMSQGFSENALFPYQAALEGMDERSFQLPRYDTAQALSELDGSGIVCPPADEALLETYLRYLREVDFLPAPGAAPLSSDFDGRAAVPQG